MKKLLFLALGVMVLFAALLSSVPSVSSATLTNDCENGCVRGKLVSIVGTLSPNYEYDIIIRKKSTGEIMWDPWGTHTADNDGYLFHYVSTRGLFWGTWPAGEYTIIVSRPNYGGQIIASSFFLTDPPPKPKPVKKTKYPTIADPR